MNATDVQLTQCQAETEIYCCGVNVTQSTCCGNGFRIAQGQAVAVNATTTSQTSTGNATATAPSVATSSAPPVHQNNTGAIIGGALGGFAAIAIIGGVLWFLFSRRRRRQPGSPTSDNLLGWMHRRKITRSSELDTLTGAKSAHEVTGLQEIEIDGQMIPSELEGSNRQAELRELEGSRPGRG